MRPVTLCTVLQNWAYEVEYVAVCRCFFFWGGGDCMQMKNRVMDDKNACLQFAIGKGVVHILCFYLLHTVSDINEHVILFCRHL